ncbi:MAG TPA: HEAT repeat domain-containing protein [Acidimicrobiales bacterium]|nr:HEAT repeat domain-containing protein [Acidimicrobiales bacterium]
MVDAAGRRRAAALAGHTGDAGKARALLSDPDPGVRATALAALARLGHAGGGEVAAALADPSPEVRRRACAVAVAVGEGDLAALLDDADTGVVEAAAWALGERGEASGDVVARLSAVAADHEDPLCREAAVAALGALGDEGGVPAILAATRDKPAVRRRAVIALAPFEGPEVEDALARALDDRDWQVRQAAEDLRD